MKRLNSLILSTITAGFLVGCGGGGSSSGAPLATTGTLIDNIISGVKYVNGTDTGYTDSNGNFPYTSGLVEFYLGDIKLGELSSMTSDNKVFIQDIIGIDRTNTTDNKLLKIAGLLQSLDSDSSTDEIEINSSDFTKFENTNKTIDDLNISTILTSNGFSVKTPEEVRAHIINSQKQHGVISDTTAIELVSSSITNGQTGVSTNASIVLTFSEDIPKQYLTNEYFRLVDYPSGNDIELTIEGDKDSVTIKPINNFSYSQSLEFTVSSKLKDFAGNSLVNNGGNTDVLIEFLVEDEVDITAPIISNSSTINIDENQTTAFTINATDNSSSLIYSISGTDADLFNIDSTTGEITFKAAPDYETKNSYVIIVKAVDTSNNSTSKEITISINDIYEPDVTAPVFTDLPPELGMHSGVNENDTTFSVTITATDESEITYSLTGVDASYFNIDSTTGEITFKSAPDYETKDYYEIYVVATDSSNNSSQSGIIGIQVIDVYENTVPSENISLDDYSNTQSSATEVSLNTTTTGSLELSDDIDYLKFELTEQTTISIEALTTLNLANYEIYKQGLSNKIFDSSFNNNSTKIDNLTLDSGVYYIKIYSILNYLTDYQIAIKGSSGIVNHDDYSNTQSSAAEVSLNTTTTGSLELSDDIDYLKFELTEQTTISIEALTTLNLANYEIYKQGLSNKIFDSSFNNNSTKIDNLTLDSGVYYIKIYSILNYLTDYQIAIKVAN
jgi:hypothetical protein